MSQATFVQCGESLDYTPGGTVSSGDIKVIGSRWGVVNRDGSSGVLNSIQTEGVFDIVSKNEAFTDGAPVFWDATGDPYGGTAGSGAATGTDTGVFLGYAVGAAGSTDGVVRVATDQPRYLDNLRTAITDPGNGGAIPVTKSGHVAIVTAGAETRTLAAPSFAGQRLQIYMKTDGGDAVITVATTFNQAGNTTITLNDTGDSIILTAVEQGSNLRWRANGSNDGCTLA